MNVRNWNLRFDRVQLMILAVICAIGAGVGYAIVTTAHSAYVAKQVQPEPCHRDQFGRRLPCPQSDE